MPNFALLRVATM